MNANPPGDRPPFAIRITARSALISLVIALSTLLLANVEFPVIIRTGLKLVFLAASAVGVTALLLWVIFSGVRIVFSRREEDPHESSGDFWR